VGVKVLTRNWTCVQLADMKLQKVSSEALAVYCVKFHGVVFSYLSTSCCDISYSLCCRQNIYLFRGSQIQHRISPWRTSTDFFCSRKATCHEVGTKVLKANFSLLGVTEWQFKTFLVRDLQTNWSVRLWKHSNLTFRWPCIVINSYNKTN